MMTCSRPLIALLFLGLACVVRGKEGDELKAVVVLFRHGDRSPLKSWPNDIYLGNSTLWPDGYGQLNNLGKERHYRLGQWFRERYDGFLPHRYNRSDIYVRSTDVDRTLMSAASNLAGLYPPEGDQVWNENIPWQAIPIHTVPEDQDAMLRLEGPCPKQDWLIDQLLNSEEFQLSNAELAELFQNISEAAGYSSVDLKTFEELFSAITIYKGFNWPLPEWTETYWPQIKALAAKGYQITTYTTDLARLTSGPFFDYLLSYFNVIKYNSVLLNAHARYLKITDSPAQKFLMLSAHESTIAAHTDAMGVYPDAVPEFGSSHLGAEKKPKELAVPIHTIPENEDSILSDKIPCPKHETLMEELLNSEKFRKINQDLAELYRNISEATGYPVEECKITTFATLFTTITIYREMNLELPAWTEDYWSDIQTWGAMKFQLTTYTSDLARLRTGPFFDYLLKHFDDVRLKAFSSTKHVPAPGHRFVKIATAEPPKFLMLSAHDTTIGERTNAMGIFPDVAPQFASTVIWELKQNEEDVYVNMYFKNSTGLNQMVLPGCDFDCNLSQFAGLLEHLKLTEDDWTAECSEG